jgi:SAM-dependent methyltransferase
MSEFDAYAHDYESALRRGLAVSGESREFFVRGRIAWLAHCLQSVGFVPDTVLDYGCGTGTATPLLFELLGARSVIGVDLSVASLEVARRSHRDLPVEYRLPTEYDPQGLIDLVYCNGVFHHVRVREQPSVVAYVASCLRPGGKLALYENNSWSVGARYVMSKIPFDRNAVMLTARQSRLLLRAAGFEAISTHYLFLWPRFLRFLRCTERYLSRLPLGAQYQLLANKPR